VKLLGGDVLWGRMGGTTVEFPAMPVRDRDLTSVGGQAVPDVLDKP
jgi:hypothetical protein